MSLASIVIAIYALMFVLMIYAEATKFRRRGLPAVFGALFLSVVAGVISCSIAAQQSGGWNWIQADAARKKPAGRTSYGGEGGGGGERAAASTGIARDSGAGAADVTEGGTHAPDACTVLISNESIGAMRSGLSAGFAGLLGRWKQDLPPGGGTVKDCEICPEMITVGGGSATIGAAHGDPLATASETPQRSVRFWPGFMISKDPVSEAAVAQFRSLTGHAETPCARSSGARLGRDAVCISPLEADAFASWLTSQAVGQRYRLASAAEWEFAARTLGVVQVASASNTDVASAPLARMGSVLSEIVADCWSPGIPMIGRELLAQRTAFADCQQRVLKGGGADEDRRYARPSARRPIEANRGAPSAGFRVVRELR